MQKYFLAIIVALIATCSVNAQDADPVQKKLEEAKSQFELRISKARAKLDDAVGKLIVKTEANRRLSAEEKISAIENLKSARKEFQDSGTIPTLRSLKSSATSFERSLKIEKQRARKAFDAAADAYGKARDLDAAKTVLAERDEFLKNQGAVAKPDGFHVGAVWKGKRFAKPSGTEKPSVIVIKQRRGNSFAGTLSVTNPRLGENISEIKGAIQNGTISIEGIDGIQKLRFVLTGRVTADGLVLDKKMKPPASQQFRMTLVSSKGDAKKK